MTTEAIRANMPACFAGGPLSPDAAHSVTGIADVHGYFGLSYANYLVLHRTLLQSMPLEWQQSFVRCLQEYEAAFEHLERPEAFDVTAVRDRYLDELTLDEAERIGYTVEIEEDETRRYGPDGEDLTDECAHVLWPKPDPIPHYDRGRAHIAPNLDAIRACRQLSEDSP